MYPRLPGAALTGSQSFVWYLNRLGLRQQFKPLLYLPMRLRTLLLASGALLLALACDKKKEEPTPQPQPTKAEIKIPAESQAVFSQGISIQAGTSAQSQTVKFSTTAAWSTDVTDTKASTWLSVQPASGSAGTVNMTVTAQPNTDTEGREASVIIKCGTVTQKFSVKQAGVPKVDVTEVSLDKAELSLVEGQEAELKATVKPDNATDKTVTWSTSDATVATVADGKVKAVKAGTATITAKAGAKEATCKVTVTAAVVAVESVKLDKTTLQLIKGQEATLTATVTPDNATDKTVAWSSSDASIASVDQAGKVTAVKSGKVTITAAAGEKSATCEVTVTTQVQSVSLDRTTVSLEEGQTTTLTATISPNDADEQTVTWTTSNAATATVANGVVTAVAEGSAVIKASAGSKEASCTVTVQKKVIAVTEITLNKATLELKKGQSETLVATVAPDDATDKTVTWTTSNAGVATVVDGLVTAVEEGTAIIQASAGDKTARCEVAVTAYHISVSPTSLSFLSAGGSKDIKISCNGDWSISGQPSWCTPSATTGTGDATIQLTVSANNDAKRTGSLTITCSGMTNTVSITQIGSGWQNQRFVHKSLYLMFTSVHCGYSVGMNERIKLADEKVGDKYCRVDVHGRGMGNPLLESPIDFDEAPTLYGLFYGGIPSGVIDYRIRIRNWSDSDSHLVVENFVSAIAEQEKIYPAQTGVSFVSSISGSTLTVSGKVYSHVAEDFKISVYLLEDGIQGSSLGYTSEFYTSRQFDNVLRLSLSNVLGDEISFGTKNSVQEFKYSTTIPEGYNKDNLSILVIVQRGYADQIVREEYMGDYYVDNCRKAKVGTEARLEVYENASGGGNEGISIGDDITF